MRRCEFSKLALGMMDPEGRFYPCDYMEHMKLADEIIEEMSGAASVALDPEKELKLNGWLSIHMLDYHFMFLWEGNLTPEQIRVIKPIVESDSERVDRVSLSLLQYEFER